MFNNSELDLLNYVVNIECSKQCPNGCNETIYLTYNSKIYTLDQFMTENNVTKIKYGQQNVNMVIYSPKLLLYDLIIALTNIINFWHGITIMQFISLIKLQLIFSIAYNRLRTFNNRLINYFILLKISWIKFKYIFKYFYARKVR